MKIVSQVLLLCCVLSFGIALAQENPKNQTKKKPVKLKKVDPEKSKIKQVKAITVPEKKEVKKKEY